MIHWSRQQSQGDLPPLAARVWIFIVVDQLLVEKLGVLALADLVLFNRLELVDHGDLLSLRPGSVASCCNLDLIIASDDVSWLLRDIGIKILPLWFFWDQIAWQGLLGG